MEALGLPAGDIALVSSNGFDIAGARSFGLKTIRIARTSPAALQGALTDPTRVEPRTMVAALRSQLDAHAGEPDFSCSSSAELVSLAASAVEPTRPEAP